jgi:2-keto-3-deoxy-L-fuconate dehydrogenase
LLTEVVDLETQSKSQRLAHKVAVVTGGGSGIGRAVAITFAQAGACVYVLDVDAAAAEAVTCGIVLAGGHAKACHCDVSIQESVRVAFNKIFEDGHIDILVNNAGISHVGNLETTPEHDFDRIYCVNVKGMYNCMLVSIGHMKANNGGVILNMASVAATSGLSDRFAYSMSKGAVVAMTYSVAKDYLPYRIRCNCISPARVHTAFVDGFLRRSYPGNEREMFEKLEKSQPIGRMGTPEEVAELVLFLCSDGAAFITGVNYPIDGGFLNLRG